MAEAMANTITGFLIAWLLNSLVLPLYGFNVQVVQSFQMTCIFTVFTTLRSYLWRRYFNRGD